MDEFEVIPAMPTIFDRKEEISPDETAKVIEFLNGTSCTGIAVSMVGGEFYKLSSVERVSLYSLAMEHIEKGKKVYAGVTHTGLKPAIMLSKAAEDAGVTAIIVMPPIKNPFETFTVKNMEKYFSMIAKSVEIPFIVQDYNFSLPSEFFVKLKEEYSNFSGIKIEGKDFNSIIDRIKQLRKDLGSSVSILGGMLGANIVREFAAGSSGVIPGSSLVDYFPHRSKKTMPLIGKKNECFSRILPVLQFEVRNFDYFVHLEKIILKHRGVIESTVCRSPTSYPPQFMERKLNKLLLAISKNLNF